MAEDQTMSLMQRYLDSILEANKVTNLTRITDGEQARLLHIEDSLVGLPEVNEAPTGLYGDLGWEVASLEFLLRLQQEERHFSLTR